MFANNSVLLGEPIRRNLQVEINAIISSITDLNLRNADQPSDLRKYMRVSFDRRGNPLFCNGIIKMHPRIPNSYYHIPIPAFPFDQQPACDPQIIEYLKDGELRIINDEDELQAKFIMLRLGQIDSLEPGIFLGTWNQADMDYANYLAKKSGLTGGWNCSQPKDGPWVKVPLRDGHIDSNAHAMPVYDENGILAYMLEVLFNHPDDTYAILPVMYFQNKHYSEPLRLYIPPAPPYCLWGMHFLREYPRAPVFITDDPLVAFTNPPSNKGIFLFNPGGDEWIDKLDLMPLRGRKIYGITFDGRLFIKSRLTSGIKLIERLNSMGFDPEMAMVSSRPYSSRLSSTNCPIPINYMEKYTIEITKTKDYVKKAQKAGVPIPAAISVDRFGEIDTDAVKDSVPLIKDLLDRGSITTIIEHNKVPQGMISPIILSALRHSLDPLPRHWKNHCLRNKRCLAYIDIEQQRRYLRQLNLSNSDWDNCKQNDEEFLLSPKFLEPTVDDGAAMFNSTMRQYCPHVVIFDADSIWEGGSKNISTMKQAIRYCIKKDIAVVLIVRNEKVLRYLATPDRLVRVWAHPSKEQHYIVETQPNIGEEEISPFEFWHDGSRWRSETLSKNIIDKIHERKTVYDKPGVSPDIDDFFMVSSPDSISDKQ